MCSSDLGICEAVLLSAAGAAGAGAVTAAPSSTLPDAAAGRYDESALDNAGLSTGNGGLQFSPGELRTALDEDLPITCLVWNNAGFGEIASAMRHANTEVIGCTPSPLGLCGRPAAAS